MTDLRIRHDRLGEYNQSSEKYVIYVEAHKLKNHKCGIMKCKTKRKKICIYIVLKCANYRDTYQATVFQYSGRQKAQIIP